MVTSGFVDAASFNELYAKAIKHIESITLTTLPKQGPFKNKDTITISSAGIAKGNISVSTE